MRFAIALAPLRLALLGFVVGAAPPKWWRTGMPPYEMPEEARDEFTMRGRVPVAKMYVDDSGRGSGTHYGAKLEQITALIEGFQKARARETATSKHAWFFEALDEFPAEGKSVVVYGSIEPVVEAILLARGARNVTTIEYNKLSYDHPQLRQLRPWELEGQRFDIAVSLSSFDHDGLGRYGDPVNPNGDLEAMAGVQAALARDGICILSVPVGPDVVVWNLHRRYGRLRLPSLLQGWRVLRRFGWDESRLDADASWRRSYEPIHVLTPSSTGVPGEKPSASKAPLDREL